MGFTTSQYLLSTFTSHATGELFVRALIRRVALRIAEEAAQRPRTAQTPSQGSPYQGTQGPYAEPVQPRDPSRWMLAVTGRR